MCKRLPLVAAIYLAFGSALAQEAAQTPPAQAPARQAVLDTVTVTAQKRTEDVQKVPISIQVLGKEKLDELDLKDFNDYAAYVPALSFDTGEGGSAVPYMRGVASGENSNHSGPQPSVGVYFDEQPVTTIGGVLDINLYDIDHVEALAGPQGTLYGASSQAGTLRIITRKPDKEAFSAGYAFGVNTLTGGDNGFVAEGFVNLPIGKNAAIRVVAWDKKDAGYVDNKPATRTFPSWDADSGGNGTITNVGTVAEDNYNDIFTRGARAALRFDFAENWSVTPMVMTQKTDSYGNFAGDDHLGDYIVNKYYPESATDDWTSAALTVEGKIGNFDLTYAYSHLRREIDSEFDYSDYSFWYDSLDGSGAYFYDDTGALINPSQIIVGVDKYTKQSHELRIASPSDEDFRFVAGVFFQKQTHDILQQYKVIGDLAASLEVTGWPDTIWLTNQGRRDTDEAAFGEVSYDFNDHWTATVGARYFRYDNSLRGFFGYSAGYSSNYGEALCFLDTPYHGAPCVNLDNTVKKSDTIFKGNLTYHIDENKLIYGTWSEGFRPGGLNRNGNVGPYLPDYLTNWELGWKTTWQDNRLAFNGAVFQEDWDDIQYSFLPPSGSGLTVIRNAGNARVRGLEMDLSWAATYNFRLNGGVAFYDAELTKEYCGFNDLAGNPVTACPPGTVNPNDPLDPDDDEVVDGAQAPVGTRLPVTPRFKGNVTGRYAFDIGSLESYVQGSLVHVGSRPAALTREDLAAFGDLDSYTQFDFSVGIRKDTWSLDFFLKNAFDDHPEQTRFAQCATDTCGFQSYTVHGAPRSIGIRFSQEF
ncbi:TonB-dependent receptor [Lysobacter dokdonensis DS-58]|uniref:TonB-dependent receptor n=1 Tax=Lysobacter dokdonensis DS-58 TaxID=1300345 RepID=A0A0A2WDN3_9GAMM|nr:TonB-dependent receptor [Lysobacter dokdonensis]KGQ17843.1 TonB-dependent receptor [Lysobacter dokdonensis DS-58]